MKSFKNLVLSLIRILTPQDLARLSEERLVGMDMAVGAETVVSKKSKPKHLRIADEPASLKDELENLGILDQKKVRALELERQEREKNSKIREEDIVLSEREKWKGGEDKLVQLSGFESYKKSAELRLLSNTSVDENGRNKFNFSKTQGVLINKKQA